MVLLLRYSLILQHSPTYFHFSVYSLDQENEPKRQVVKWVRGAHSFPPFGIYFSCSVLYPTTRRINDPTANVLSAWPFYYFIGRVPPEVTRPCGKTVLHALQVSLRLIYHKWWEVLFLEKQILSLFLSVT